MIGTSPTSYFAAKALNNLVDQDRSLNLDMYWCLLSPRDWLEAVLHQIIQKLK
jgi:hypothetical protein